MISLATLDASVPLARQLESSTGPIYVVGTYLVPDEALEAFVALWRADAAVMATQPGFVHTRLHRGTAGSRLLYSIAQWASTQALAAAIGVASRDPDIGTKATRLGEDTIAYIHVFDSAPCAEVLAEPNRKE